MASGASMTGTPTSALASFEPIPVEMVGSVPASAGASAFSASAPPEVADMPSTIRAAAPSVTPTIFFLLICLVLIS
jgi:hypothetical protein